MTQEAAPIQLTGVERASLLLITLGSKTASNVMQHLTPEEATKLASQIAKQKKVDPVLQEQVVQEYIQSRDADGVGGLGYAQELLEQALGPAKAKEVMSDITAGSGGRPFDWLKGMSASRVATSLLNERPQVISLVLAHLPGDRAAEVISQLPDSVQGKVAYRLTSMQPVAPEMVKAVEEVLRAKISKDATGDLKNVGGLQSLVAILNNADRTTEGKIMKYLEGTESAIAESVKSMMFVFEDTIKLDDRAIQIIIRELEQEDLRLSLKGAMQEIKDLFFRNMSERAAETLREDLEMMGPVRRKDVEAAQRRVVAVIRRLDEAGEISLREEDEEVVS